MLLRSGSLGNSITQFQWQAVVKFGTIDSNEQRINESTNNEQRTRGSKSKGFLRGKWTKIYFHIHYIHSYLLIYFRESDDGRLQSVSV